MISFVFQVVWTLVIIFSPLFVITQLCSNLSHSLEDTSRYHQALNNFFYDNYVDFEEYLEDDVAARRVAAQKSHHGG